MATIFDLLTFFGLSSFFAWLAFAVLQNEQLDKFEEDVINDARRNFARINNYFLVSFAFSACAAVGYYAYHNPGYLCYGFFYFCWHSPITLIIVGVGFLGGIITLGIPIWYIHLVSKGDRTWPTVNPPEVVYTLLVSGSTATGIAIAALAFGHASSLLGTLVWVPVGFGCLFGAQLTMSSWSDKGPRNRAGQALIALPYVLFFVLSVARISL